MEHDVSRSNDFRRSSGVLEANKDRFANGVHPDITVMVDWTLNSNLFPFLLIMTLYDVQIVRNGLIPVPDVYNYTPQL